MKLSNSQNMSINFSPVVLILCKNQQMKDTVLVLLVFMILLRSYDFKVETPEYNFLNLHFY